MKIQTYKIEGLRITKPQIAKTYQEAKDKCPKGFRLPHLWELFKIFESRENREKLSDGTYMSFWSDFIENKYAKGLCLVGDINLFSNSVGLAYSNVNGRVVFVKDVRK